MIHFRRLLASLFCSLMLASAAPAQTQTPGLQGDYWGPNLAAIPATPGVPAGNPSLTRVDTTVDYTTATYPAPSPTPITSSSAGPVS